MRAVAGENFFIPGGCLAASAGSGAEPQGGILHEHPRKPSPYVNIRTSDQVITLNSHRVTEGLFGMGETDLVLGQVGPSLGWVKFDVHRGIMHTLYI